jgi:acetyl esterase/lipase
MPVNRVYVQLAEDRSGCDRTPERRKVGSSILPLTTSFPRVGRSPLTCMNSSEKGIRMALDALILKISDLRKRSRADARVTAESQEERKTMTVPQPPAAAQTAGAEPFAPEIGSFRQHLAAEGKAAKTVRTYTEAVQWFAAAHLIPRTGHTRWDHICPRTMSGIASPGGSISAVRPYAAERPRWRPAMARPVLERQP